MYSVEHESVHTDAFRSCPQGPPLRKRGAPSSSSRVPFVGRSNGVCCYCWARSPGEVIDDHAPVESRRSGLRKVSLPWGCTRSWKPSCWWPMLSLFSTRTASWLHVGFAFATLPPLCLFTLAAWPISFVVIISFHMKPSRRCAVVTAVGFVSSNSHCVVSIWQMA